METCGRPPTGEASLGDRRPGPDAPRGARSPTSPVAATRSGGPLAHRILRATPLSDPKVGAGDRLEPKGVLGAPSPGTTRVRAPPDGARSVGLEGPSTPGATGAPGNRSREGVCGVAFFDRMTESRHTGNTLGHVPRSVLEDSGPGVPANNRQRNTRPPGRSGPPAVGPDDPDRAESSLVGASSSIGRTRRRSATA